MVQCSGRTLICDRQPQIGHAVLEATEKAIPKDWYSWPKPAALLDLPLLERLCTLVLPGPRALGLTNWPIVSKLSVRYYES